MGEVILCFALGMDMDLEVVLHLPASLARIMVMVTGGGGGVQLKHVHLGPGLPRNAAGAVWPDSRPCSPRRSHCQWHSLHVEKATRG